MCINESFYHLIQVKFASRLIFKFNLVTKAQNLWYQDTLPLVLILYQCEKEKKVYFTKVSVK